MSLAGASALALPQKDLWLLMFWKIFIPLFRNKLVNF